LRNLSIILRDIRMTRNTYTSGDPAEDGVRSATRFAVGMTLFANRITLSWLLAIAGASACPAGELNLSVVDREGLGVSDAVVTVAPLERHVSTVPRTTAVMDQRNVAFVPRVLVVSVGTTVDFPNNDTVSHQVYSFSPAKKFQLPLYKGAPHAPVIFDHEGLVVLGCNIHDSMAGYIYVTDSPLFGKTDAAGMLRVQNVPPGDYRIVVWSPYIADPASSLIRTLHMDSQGITAAQVQLSRELRKRPEPRPRRADWDY
jgi:plastocyanin